MVRPSQIFDSFMDEFFNAPGWGGNSGFASVDVNVKDQGDNILVTAKMPGFTQEEINIHVEENNLVIEGNKSEEKSEGSENTEYFVKEFTTQNVKRSVNLPAKVDGEKAEALIKDGILSVTLPKLPEVMPKKIPIKTI